MPVWYAGIGSRGAPDDILILMARLGRTLTDKGFSLSSGDAIGSDYAFYVGARLSPRFFTTQPRIYLARNGAGRRYEKLSLGFINAKGLVDQYEEAQAIAIKARGGIYGLNEYGIELHTRNAFQVLGSDLKQPVQAVYYYAEPLPRNPDKVKGGTNTALQIAKAFGIEILCNLYVEDTQNKVKAWLDRNESARPYPIDLLDMIHSRKSHQPVF